MSSLVSFWKFGMLQMILSWFFRQQAVPILCDSCWAGQTGTKLCLTNTEGTTMALPRMATEIRVSVEMSMVFVRSSGANEFRAGNRLC